MPGQSEGRGFDSNRGEAILKLAGSGLKVVQISARNTKVYKICEIWRALFSALYNISRPSFANFRMLFLAVVMDFVLLA